MDFSIKKSSISSIVSAGEANIPQSIDSDITLPEYVDDIDYALSCSLIPQIESTSFSDGRVTVEGRALIRLLYVSQKGTLNCFENEVPFSRFAQMQNAADTDCISVRADTQYINCRLVNPRRFDAHGSINIGVEASRVNTEQAVSCAQGAGIRTRNKKIEVSNALAVKEKQFSLSESLEISSSLPSPAQIVSISAAPSVGETKLISGKALVKGDMELNIFYIPDGEPDMIEKATFSLPISQIVELDCDEEGDGCVTDITVYAVNYVLRNETSGSVRLIDASIEASARVSVFKTEETEVVIDAYSTEYETENEIKKLDVRCLKEQFNDVCLCRSPFSASGKEIKNVLSLIAGNIVSTCSKHEGRLTVSGSVRAGLTVEYTNGEKGYIEKPLEFEYSREVDCDDFLCEKSVRVNASSFLVTSQNNIDVRVELEITGWVFEKKSMPLITNIGVKEECPKLPCSAALTLYYPDKSEQLWEIAKKYNTTVEAIKEENQLSDERTKPGAALILPRM